MLLSRLYRPLVHLSRSSVVKKQLLPLQRPNQNTFCKRWKHDTGAAGPDYYVVLGVTPAADKQQIKIAYFQRAKKYHPDSNESEEAKWMFELIAEAYDVLSDDKKKKDYDMYGHREVFGGTSGGPKRARGADTFSSEEIFSKIFGDANAGMEDPLTGVAFAESKEAESDTKEQVVHLTLEEAAMGTEVMLQMSLKVVCPKCDGTKAELGFTWQVCMFCEGTGLETVKVGHVLTRRTCSHCDGTRQYIKHKCDNCDGVGVTLKNFGYTFDIPPGVQDGQVLSVPITEDPCHFPLAEPVTIYVYLKVAAESSAFTAREGLDVFSQADASIGQALLGGTIPVRGLHTPLLELTVPALAGDLRSLCLEGHGVRAEGRHGNHFVRVGVNVPTCLTGQQLELIRRFALTEQLDAGCVAGVDTSESHRFQVNVVEADRVEREFAASSLSAEEETETVKKRKWDGVKSKFDNIIFGKKIEL